MSNSRKKKLREAFYSSPAPLTGLGLKYTYGRTKVCCLFAASVLRLDGPEASKLKRLNGQPSSNSVSDLCKLVKGYVNSGADRQL